MIECSNEHAYIYKNIEEYHVNKKRTILIVLDDTIADIADTRNNKTLNPVVTELFGRVRKLNISFVFVTNYYFLVPRNISLNSVHYFIKKILKAKESFNK